MGGTGLEPVTPSLSSRGSRVSSLLFAQTPSLSGIVPPTERSRERERTTILAILATPPVEYGDSHGRDTRRTPYPARRRVDERQWSRGSGRFVVPGVFERDKVKDGLSVMQRGRRVVERHQPRVLDVRAWVGAEELVAEYVIALRLTEVAGRGAQEETRLAVKLREPVRSHLDPNRARERALKRSEEDAKRLERLRSRMQQVYPPAAVKSPVDKLAPPDRKVVPHDR